MLKVQGHSTSNANSIAQSAARRSSNWPAGISRQRCWGNTQSAAPGCLSALREIPGITCNEPEGAFYAFPSVRGLSGRRDENVRRFARRLLEEEQTVVTDGAGFGAEGYIRISYATSMEQLQEGVRRIKRFVETS